MVKKRHRHRILGEEGLESGDRDCSPKGLYVTEGNVIEGGNDVKDVRFASMST